MASLTQKQIKWIAVAGVLLVVAAGGAAVYFVPAAREQVSGWFLSKAQAETAPHRKITPAKLILENDEYILLLSKEAMESLELNPVKAEPARLPLPLPPMIGTLNYDNDRLFTIRPRFQ